MEQHNEDIEAKKDLVLYRIQTVKDNLKSAGILFKRTKSEKFVLPIETAIFICYNFIYKKKISSGLGDSETLNSLPAV